MQEELDAVEEALSCLLDAFPEPSVSDPVAFLSAQFDAGLAWVHFDVGRGGLGLPTGWQPEVARRLAAAGAPPTRGDFVAVHQVSATLHELGSPHQEHLLRRIFTGEDHWCQLFSEPGAGSDLAGVAALATRDASGWRISGQKVWTSGAREATYALLLVRTDPEVPKHRGLTMFVLDMASSGVEVRPLRQADGGARFNEVFLQEVWVADADRLGDVGAGWGVSLRVLNTEREGASNVFLRPLDELLALWAARRDVAAPGLRDDVVRLWIEAQVIDLNERRRLVSSRPEEKARLAAISKIAASEHAQRLGSLLATVAGPGALVGCDYDAAYASDLRESTASPTKFHTMPLQTFLIRSRAMSIEGGTNEIQRNIVGERVLGLPADIRVDKNRPWREVRNG